jgi:hypothetical protein
MKLSLSSEINTARLTQEFSLSKKVQISQILPVEQTAAIYQFLHRDVTFDQAFTLNNKAALLSKDSLNRMTRSEFIRCYAMYMIMHQKVLAIGTVGLQSLICLHRC